MKPTHDERRKFRFEIVRYLGRHSVAEAAKFYGVHPQFIYGIVREFRLLRKKGYDNGKAK